MYYIIGKKDNKDCCWFGAYEKKVFAQKDIKQLRSRLPMFKFRISSKYRKNYANFVVQGAISLAPYLTKFAKHIPKLAIKLKPFGKVVVKNLKQLPKIVRTGLKNSSDWLPSVLLILNELKEIAPDNQTLKQLDEMGKTAKEIDKKAKELEKTIPK
tara:strand:+ start:116 stop:583 length:468 start_codon:yes stop_codon:yes gene_type:complete